MAPDDPRVRDLLTRSMNMRVATMSSGGVPHITPLRFVYDGRNLYALTRAGSPAARHIGDTSGVVLLFDAEETDRGGPVLHLRAGAARRREPQLMSWLERRAATKYFLRPGGMWNMLTHWRNLPTWLRRRRNATPDDMALLEFVPHDAELVSRPAPVV